MKAPDFSYERPGTLAEAFALLAGDGDAAPLAGGQSLMPMMNLRMARPEMLVDLNRLPELAGIADEGDALRIGAMTRYAELERSDLVARHLPLLPMALPHIAHDAVRNRGTVGGSAALADPAAELPALLLALDARVIVSDGRTEREIAADDFFLGLYETALEPGELILALRISKAGAGDGHAFYELARRHGDYAVAGVAVVRRNGALRIAYFSVSDRAVRARGAEEILGRDSAAVDQAIASLDEIDFAGDLNAGEATKKHLAGVVLRRALEAL